MPTRLHRTHRRGFTLVELLVVIAILAILLTVAVLAFTSLFGKAKGSRSAQACKIVVDMLNELREQFPVRTPTNAPGGVERGFPIKAHWPDAGAIQPSQMSDGEWLRLLLYPTQDELDNYLSQFGITERLADREVFERFLNDRDIEFIVDPTSGNISRQVARHGAVVDGWNRPLYYRFPGASHVIETNSRGMSGMNHYDLGIPDVWSAGEDQISEYGPYHGVWQPGQQELTDWAAKINDPTSSGDVDKIDDVANWFPTSQY